MINQSITWVIADAANTGRVATDTSGPHKIYVIAGTPQRALGTILDVTDIRMDEVIKDAAKAQANARTAAGTQTPTSARVVYEMLNLHVFNLNKSVFFDNPHLGAAALWLVPQYWDTVSGADCLSGAAFITAVARMAGVPGTTDYAVLTAKSADPANNFADAKTAVPFTRLGYPLRKIITENDGRSFVARLYLIDRNDKRNDYEAAIVYTFGGRTLYFASGAQGQIYASAQHVLYVFQRLEWRYLDGNNERKVPVWSYVNDPQKPPDRVPID